MVVGSSRRHPIFLTSQFPTSERWDVADRLWTKTPPSGCLVGSGNAFIGVVKLWMSKREKSGHRGWLHFQHFSRMFIIFFALNPLLWTDSVSGYVDSRNSGNQFLAWAFLKRLNAVKPLTSLEFQETTPKIQSCGYDSTPTEKMLPCPRLETVEKQIKALGLKTDDDSLQEAGRCLCHAEVTGHQTD